MLIRSFVRVCVASVVVVATAAAQSDSGRVTSSRGRGEILGRVVNATTQAPLTGARVEVKGLAVADTLSRAVAGADGAFHVIGLRNGSYRIRISAIGFAPRDLPPIAIGAATPNVDVGAITLTPSVVELSSVVVRDRKTDVELAPDRNAYVVKDLPSTKGGTVLDVLRNVPSVDVDIDNIVSLRGNAGVVIQINGRPSPMKATQLGNFLAQLPADVVDKVEVVANPSAREDPTGVAGIINIVLKQEADAGTSGGVSIGGVTTGTANISANYGYSKGPLSLYGSYGLMHDRRTRNDVISRDNLFVVPTTFLDETGQRLQQPLMHTLTGSATYSLGKSDELSSDLLFSTRTEPEQYNVRYTSFDPSHRVDSLSNRYTDGMNHENSLETTLGYKHKFAEKGRKFSAELRFNQGLEGGPTNVTANNLTLNGSPVGATQRETSSGFAHPSDGDFKIDYAQPLSKILRLEAGYKGSLQQFHSTLDTHVLDTASGVFTPDSTRIGDVTFDQRVHAMYGMLSAALGQFTVQGGLRAEHASTTFRIRTTGASYDNAYDELFPSGLVIYHVDDARQLKLSYSTRINRPDDTDILDPTPHVLDPLNISRGNPYLKPEIIRAVEIGLQQTTDRLTVQITPYFRRTFDAVRTLCTIDSLGVSTRTYANISTSDESGLDLTVALRGGRLTGFGGATVFRQDNNASNVAQALSLNAVGWSARTNVTYRIAKSIDAQALVSYQAPMDVVQGFNASRTRISLAVREKFMEDQLSVTLRILDPFSTARESSTTVDPRFYQLSERMRVIRGLGLNFSWTFGKPDKSEKTDLIGEPPAS